MDIQLDMACVGSKLKTPYNEHEQKGGGGAGVPSIVWYWT